MKRRDRRDAARPRQPAVLVVDDSAEVAEVTSSLFDHLGYDTLYRESAEAALKLLAEGASVDLVFSDIVMPGTIDGVGLASEIRSLSEPAGDPDHRLQRRRGRGAVAFAYSAQTVRQRRAAQLHSGRDGAAGERRSEYPALSAIVIPAATSYGNTLKFAGRAVSAGCSEDPTARTRF